MLPYLIGGAALGAAGFAGYHSLAWRSQLYGETFIGTPARGKKLALTYDDGPNDPHTLNLLDVLAKHDVKATFFLIGRFAQKRPDIVRRIYVEGHEIGNHTHTHPRLPLLNRCAVVKEFLHSEAMIHMGKADPAKREYRLTLGSGPILEPSCEEMIEQAKKIRESSGTTLFRPPFGLRRPATLRVARELGYTPVMWTVTCWDWKKTTADRVEQHARRQITGGDVILMHDGGFERMGADRAHTVIATDRIIGSYKQEGFEFVTVPEMMFRAS
jgi:peptidoglycan/xylan/chitin deacetylase (PgdA/CDA1 family)